LQELNEALLVKNKSAGLLDEAHWTADFILCVSSTTAVALDKGITETIVAQWYLWLTLMNLPKAQCSDFLHLSVDPSGSFRHALAKIQTCCDQRMWRLCA